jgi:Protein of unknown function (DUF2752)
MSPDLVGNPLGPLGFQPGWPKRILLVALVLSPLFAAVLVDMPMCPTAALFGLPCPGCGLTRATLAMFRGDLSAALRFHPLVFLATPMYFGVLGSIAWGYVRGGVEKIPSGRLTKFLSALALTTFVLLMGVWLARFFGAFGGPVEIKRLSVPGASSSGK